MKHLHRISWTLCLLGILGLAVTLISRPTGAQSDEQLPLSPNRHKGGSLVRATFTPVVAPAAKSVVRVLCDGQEIALGTIVNKQGLIFTKASELKDGAELTFLTSDGRSVSAKMVAVSQFDDIAILQASSIKGLTPIRWASSGEPALGQWMATVSPDGTARAVGVMSVHGRKIARMFGVLGVKFGQPVANLQGVRIEEVFEGTPAQEAGLKAGDVITRINNVATPTLEAAHKRVRMYQPRDKIRVTFMRDNQQMEKPIVLGDKSDVKEMRTVDDQMNTGSGSLSRVRSGFPMAMQHDTVLSPRDCGGPLVNLDGQAVGLNIARAGRVVSYALPAQRLVALLDDYKAGKLKAKLDEEMPPPDDAQPKNADQEGAENP